MNQIAWILYGCYAGKKRVFRCLSFHKPRNLREEAAKVGVNDYFVQPVTERQLRDAKQSVKDKENDMTFKPNHLLYGANGGFFSTFRLAIRMKETVDYDLLSRSVEKVMERYPYFCVRPAREGETLVLRYNDQPLPVFPDDRTVTLGSEESRGHLISFGCKDNTIFIDCSHYIADGMGIDPLMKTLLYRCVDHTGSSWFFWLNCADNRDQEETISTLSI